MVLWYEKKDSFFRVIGSQMFGYLLLADYRFEGCKRTD